MTEQSAVAVADAPPKLRFAPPGAVTAPPPLEVAPAVDRPIATGLATVSKTPEQRESVVCKDMLEPDLQVKASSEAAELLPKMLKNTGILMHYGEGSLTGINELVDRLMGQLNTNNVGPLREIMKDLTLGMKAVQGKYDLTTDKGKKTYDEWDKGRFKKFLRWGRNYIQSMMADIKSVETQLDEIERDLNERKNNMLRNIIYLDQLEEENEKAIFQLIYVIAVMENVIELARAEAERIPNDPPGTGNTNTQKKEKLADLILQMNVKTGEYKGRLWVAWSTTPQVRKMRILSVGMAQKLHEAVAMTIPTMKLVIVQMALMVEAQEGAKASEAVSEATNLMVQELARGSADSAGVIMEAIQSPTILPETMTSVTESLTRMGDNILAAIEVGDQKRAEAEQTMALSKTQIDANSGKFNKAVIEQIIDGSTEPVQLPASKETFALPAAGESSAS